MKRLLNSEYLIMSIAIEKLIIFQQFYCEHPLKPFEWTHSKILLFKEENMVRCTKLYYRNMRNIWHLVREHTHTHSHGAHRRQFAYVYTGWRKNRGNRKRMLTTVNVNSESSFDFFCYCCCWCWLHSARQQHGHTNVETTWCAKIFERYNNICYHGYCRPMTIPATTCVVLLLSCNLPLNWWSYFVSSWYFLFLLFLRRTFPVSWIFMVNGCMPRDFCMPRQHCVIVHRPCECLQITWYSVLYYLPGKVINEVFVFVEPLMHNTLLEIISLSLAIHKAIEMTIFIGHHMEWLMRHIQIFATQCMVIFSAGKYQKSSAE